MDRTDKRILDILQSNCKITNQELADQVSLSPSPCLRRVNHLEEGGYINKYVALLDPEKVGLSLTIITLVGLTTHDPKLMKNFEEIMEASAEVLQCYLIAGQSADYMLRIVVPNLNVYQDFLLNTLTQIKGVANVHSSFVVKNIVEKTDLPLKYLK